MTTRKASAHLDARKAEPQDARADSPPPPGPWSPGLKWVASALIAFHLIAVFWGPLNFACRSPLTESVFAVLRPYIQAMYLGHGYSFFAPDVGSSRLLRYKIEFADGREPVVGIIPNLRTERPRLLYHRHFMLTEALSNRFVPPEPPPEPTPPPLTATAGERNLYGFERESYQRALTVWKHERRQYEAMKQSFEQHLLAAYGGSKVTLTRVEHRPATPPEVQHARWRLDAPDTYRDLPETGEPETIEPEFRP